MPFAEGLVGVEQNRVLVVPLEALHNLGMVAEALFVLDCYNLIAYV